MKERIKKLEALRGKIADLTYRQTVEGTCDDKCGEKLENKILGFITDARNIGPTNRTIEKGGSIEHKDCRKYCPKCGSVLGENIDGKPICICEVQPMRKVYTNSLRNSFHRYRLEKSTRPWKHI